jgi:hypothetical protein
MTKGIVGESGIIRAGMCTKFGRIVMKKLDKLMGGMFHMGPKLWTNQSETVKLLSDDNLLDHPPVKNAMEHLSLFPQRVAGIHENHASVQTHLSTRHGQKWTTRIYVPPFREELSGDAMRIENENWLR